MERLNIAARAAQPMEINMKGRSLPVHISVGSSHQHSFKGMAMGRVVVTHSTYIPGLLKVLRKLAAVEGITTCTPAVISHGGAHAETFQLRITRPLPWGGGFKAIARKGRSSQEVFITTQLEKAVIQNAVRRILDD